MDVLTNNQPSAYAQDEQDAQYQTSSPAENNWVQPPASQYIFYVERGTMHGIPQFLAARTYPGSLPSRVAIDPDLAADFAAWENLSDEAIGDL